MTENPARWRGFSHEELYRMLHEGPGPAASAVPSRRWAELTSALDEVGHRLEGALGAAASAWTGRAAGAAHAKLAPLAAWATTTSEGAASMRAAVEHQGDLIAKARADMPVPAELPAEPDPAAPPAVQVVGLQEDAEAAETARSAAEQRAVEVMAAYEANTKQNLAALVAFAAPPAVLRGAGVHRGRGRGVTLPTQPSTAAGGDLPGARGGADHHHHHRPLVGPTREFAGGFTQAAGAAPTGPAAGLPARPLPPIAPIAPGAPVAASPVAPITAVPLARGGPRDDDRRRERRAPGVVAGAIGAPDPHPHAPGSSAVPPGPISPAAGTAGAPVGAAGAPVGSADKVAVRRFGPEVIGSSQWFADAEVTPVRAVSGRRRDLGSTDNVTENVTVDGEDHQLPPPVIGG